MKICWRGSPPTEVKSPITRSSVPPWDSDWLNTLVALLDTPENS